MKFKGAFEWLREIAIEEIQKGNIKDLDDTFLQALHGDDPGECMSMCPICQAIDERENE